MGANVWIMAKSWAVSSEVERYLDTVEVSGSKKTTMSDSKFLRFLLKPVRVLFEAVLAFAEDNGFILSSSVSYFLILAIVPFTLFAISILGLVLSQQEYAQKFIEMLTYLVANPKTIEWFALRIEPIVSNIGTLSLWGAGTLLVVTGGMFRGMEYAMNTVFKAPPRGLFKSYAVGITFSLIINLLLLVGVIISPIMGYAAIADTPLFQNLVSLIHGLAWFLSNLFSWFVFGLLCLIIYYVLPNKKKRFRDVLFGAVTAAVLWNILKWLFGLYLQYFSTINLIYGALGTVIGAIMWMYMTVNIIIFGAEIAKILTSRAAGEPAPSFTSLIHKATLSFSPNIKRGITDRLESIKNKQTTKSIEKDKA